MQGVSGSVHAPTNTLVTPSETGRRDAAEAGAGLLTPSESVSASPPVVPSVREEAPPEAPESAAAGEPRSQAFPETGEDGACASAISADGTRGGSLSEIKTQGGIGTAPQSFSEDGPLSRLFAFLRGRSRGGDS